LATFIWTRENQASATKHGVATDDAQYVVERPLLHETVRPGVYRRWARSRSGAYIEVIFCFVTKESDLDWSQVDVMAMDADDSIVILHDRPLTESEKRRLKRRRR
jgi:uncharacterized DUF497 family protein